jgi:hypothetical protein
MKKIFIPLILVLLFSFNNHFAQNTFYVSLSGSSISPFASWATAATNIQDAVDAASPSDLILVGDGTYILTGNISVTKGITIRSVHGYLSTTISGNHATRCLYIDNAGAVIDGFTITNGYNPGGYGGAAEIVSGGTIQNCFISNSQARDGGGVAIDNSGLVQNCFITLNRADNNSGDGYGGGVRMLEGGITRNCSIYNNTSVNYGGGINIWDAGTIQNCTLVHNNAPNGSGVRCRGASVMENTISFGNAISNWQTEGSGFSFSNNCTTPDLPSGTGNISTDPQFVNSGSGDYHLLSTSPAINAGVNREWMIGAKDLDGNNRIFNGIVDIGAYEYFILPPAIPTLISPANLSAGVSIELALSWTSVAGATYSLQVATDVLFTNLIYNQSGLVNSAFNLTGLSNSTDYYWRVSAEKGLLTSGFSLPFKFTSIAYSQVLLSSPIGGVSLYTSPVSLSWYVVSGGTGWKYDLLYSTDINMTSPTVVMNLNSNSYSLSGLQPGTKYYWKIRLKTAGGAVVSYSVKESFITFGKAVVPVPSTPINDVTVYSLSPTLYWYLNEASTGLTYDVEIRQGAPAVLTGTPTSTNISSQSLVASGLQPGKQYSWHVRSKSGTLYSDWSDAESFNTVATAGPVIPIASWPVGGAIVYTTSPSLNWYLGSSSAGLTFEVEYVEGLTTSFSGSPNITNITSLSTTLSNLIAGGDYKWRVRSTDGSSTSDWSTTETFSVISSIANNPIVPTPSWPVGGAIVYSNTVQLNWYLGAFATGLIYDIELRAGSLNGTPTIVGITSLNTTVSNLTSGTTYFWRVRSSNGSITSGWSITESFQTISSAVTATVPILSWPIGGATVYTNSPTLSWYLNSPSGGITYELQYGANSNMSGAVTVSGLTSNQTILNGLTSGAIYYWRVRSFDGIVYSSFSATESFVTFAGNSASVVPVAASPAEGIFIESSSAMLSWFLPTQGDVANYELQYSKNSEMLNATNLKMNSTSQILSGLESGKSYYWRVRSVNSNGEVSSYSTLEMFTPNSTTGITDKKEIPTEFQLKQNFPNPFNPTTIMEFNIPVKGFYSLDVFNILGEKVTTLVNGMLNPGIYKTTFNGKDLSSGVYLYRLYGNNVNLVRKMLMIK